MKSLKNIVIINDSAVIDGGAAKVALKTAQTFASQGFNVSFFAGGEEYDSFFLENVNVDQVSKKNLRENGFSVKNALRGIWDGQVAKHLSTVLEKFNPDNTIIHVHSWASVLSPSVFYPIVRGKYRCIITAHDYCLVCPNSCRYNFNADSICKLVPGRLRCFLSSCDRDSYAVKAFRVFRYVFQTIVLKRLKPHVVCVSAYQRDHLVPDLCFESSDDIVPNAIELSTRVPKEEIRNNSSSLQKQIGRHHEQNSFLYIGRIEKEKGVDVFCDAVTRAGYRAVVLGSGKELANLRQKYPRIDFMGWVDSDTILAEMKKALALVFPSKWYEASPLTPIEAQLYANLPCIVSDSCASIDDIYDKITGLVFKTGDAEDLKRCMAELLENEQLRSSMIMNIVENNRIIAEKRSDVSYYSRLLKIYESEVKRS